MVSMTGSLGPIRGQNSNRGKEQFEWLIPLYKYQPSPKKGFLIPEPTKAIIISSYKN